MKLNNNIIKSALLGTNNRQIDINIFPKQIQEALDKERNQEQIFLDALSLNKAYFESGLKLDKVKNITQNIPKAPIESLPYCSENMEILLKLILRESNNAFSSFFPALVKEANKKGVILPMAYFSKIKTPKSNDIKAFGERGRWITELNARYKGEEPVPEYLSLKKTDRNKVFIQLLDKDKKEAKKFLEEVFDGETPTGRLSYLKATIENSDDESEDILSFIESYLVENPSSSKSYKNLENHLLKAKLALPNSKLFEIYHRDVFSKVWTKENKQFLVKDRPELDELFKALPFFDKNVEETLRFIFFISPVDLWCELLAVDCAGFLTVLRNMKTTYINEDFIKEVGRNAVKSKNKALIYAYLDLEQTFVSDFGFLAVFEKEELFEFAEKYIDTLLSRGVAVIKMFKEEKRFHQPWSPRFTKKVLKSLFKHGVYEKQALVKAIWTIAPYLDMEGMAYIKETLEKDNRPKHWDNLEEEFPEILKIKNAYKAIII